MKYRSGAPSLFVLDEIAFRTSGGCGFKKFSPFFKTFNEKIGQSVAAGLTKHFEMLLSPAMETKIDDIGPQVLTMEHLGLGFIACLMPIGITIVVFLMEFVVHALNSKRKNSARSLSRSFAVSVQGQHKKSRQTQTISLMKLDH